MIRSERRPVGWLPIDDDWNSLLKRAGTKRGRFTTVAQARAQMIHTLDEAAAGGAPGVLIRSALGKAEAAARRIGASLKTESGRAAVAVALYRRHRANVKKNTLGLSIGPGTIGWSLVRDDAEPLDGCNVIECFV